MIRISLQNAVAELDFREVSTPAEVRAALVDLVTSVEEFHPRDKILLSGEEDDDPEDFDRLLEFGNARHYRD